MGPAKTPLIDIHAALSHLAFAVGQEFDDIWHDVKIEWNRYTYLTVRVECRGKHVQRVTDRMMHGALNGPYDYRFTVSSPVGVPDEEWTCVTLYPDMTHDGKRFAAQSGPTEDAYMRATRALHWRTEQLRQYGIEPIEIKEGFPHYPPESFNWKVK